MDSVAIAAGAGMVACLILGYILGRESGDGAQHRRQIDAVRDAISRVMHDMRTHPHTKEQIDRDVMPLLAERKR